MPWHLPATNPVFWFELRSRMAGRTGYLLVLGYLLLLGGVVVAAMVLLPPGGDPTAYPRYGRTLWQALAVMQGVILFFVCPGLTAPGFSAERERGTLDALLMTPLSTPGLVLGKLNGALGQVLALQVAGLPILALISAAFGGIALWEVLLVAAGLSGEALLLGSLGLLASCHARRTVEAMGRAYLYVFLFFLTSALCGPVGILFIVAGIFVLPSACVGIVDTWRQQPDRALQMKYRQSGATGADDRRTTDGWGGISMGAPARSVHKEEDDAQDRVDRHQLQPLEPIGLAIERDDREDQH